MKDFEYSNLNIVEMNAFLREDTKNYKDFKNSKCGKAYEFETKTLSEDKMVISVLQNQIDSEVKGYETRKSELLDQQENFSFFQKMFGKGKKEFKELETIHNETMKELKKKLDHHQTLLQTHTLMFQNIIDELNEKGFDWSEMKRLIEEKMRQDVFNMNSNNMKSKPKVRIPKEEDYDISELMKKMKKNMDDAVDTSRNELREKDFYGLDPNDIDLSNFSPAEKDEYLRLLRRYNYNIEKANERERARMLRLSMCGDPEHNHFPYMSMGLSDYAFCGLFDFIFGDDCHHFKEMHGKCMLAHDLMDSARIREYNDFVDMKVREMLAKSGYSLSQIDLIKEPYKKEFSKLIRCPDKLSHIADCTICSKNYIGLAKSNIKIKMLSTAKKEAIYNKEAGEIAELDNGLDMQSSLQMTNNSSDHKY